MIPPPLRIAPNRFAYDEAHVEALRRIRDCSHPEPPELRARIVAAAIEAFKTRSYSEVTVSDIAEAAQTAKGNLYRYFDSKEDLLTAAVESLLSDTRSRFEEASGSLGGVEGLRADPGKAALGLRLHRRRRAADALGARSARRQGPRAQRGSRPQGAAHPRRHGWAPVCRGPRRRRGRHPGGTGCHRDGVRDGDVVGGRS